MPFFKKRKLPEQGPPIPLVNGTVPQPKVVLPTPLLHNFVPPPDIVADALAKTNRRSSATIGALLAWAREYFCAFLKNGECEFAEVFELWEECERLQANLQKSTIAISNQDRGKESDDTLEEESYSLRMRLEGLKGPIDGESFKGVWKSDEGCSGEWVREIKEKLYEVLQERCLPKYLESKYHVKCQVDLFTNGANVSLYDVLLNQSALFYFMEYAEQESKREVLEFWLVATNFSEQFPELMPGTKSTIDISTAVGDAMVLYEKYISLQASHHLGLRDEVRSEVEAKICSQDASEISHCFNTAIIEAFAFLHVTCLEGFLKSSLFLSYLSDLIGSLKSSKSQQTLDSSSVGSSGSVKSQTVSTSSSLTSPTSSIRERGKLTMGRVNALGKFEPDFDWDVFTKKESSIAKTVKKFVNFDEKEKAKEDLAWQVAEMIINEVTSVTMGMGPADQN